MSKTDTAAAADNRRKHAPHAPDVPNQSITAPASQTPPASPGANENAAAVHLRETVAISAELFHRVAEHAELFGFSVDKVVVRALVDYTERGNPARMAWNVDAYRNICKRYSDEQKAEIDGCENTGEETVLLLHKMAMFDFLRDSPHLDPFNLRCFIDATNQWLFKAAEKELDALAIAYEALKLDNGGATVAASTEE